MIFVEPAFLLLFAACWVTFFSVPRKWRSASLALWGMAFYLTYAGSFLLVVLVLTTATLLSKRSLILGWVTGAVTIGLLAFYKSAFAAGVLSPGSFEPGAVLVPLGFSYLAFELLHVLIEQRRGRIAAPGFVDLLAYVFFAPARMAGPIKRFPDFQAAMAGAEMSGQNVYAGVLRVLAGLAKKIVGADFIGLAIARMPPPSGAGGAWLTVFLYSLQIYLDFSAYSDMAIGFARMLGITLPENFRRPYFAANIREFWERWHITLSHWVRDYLFIPTGRLLFGTRLRPWPIVIATICYLVTFTVVGAWHGLTAAFVLWGVYHGILLSLYNVIRLKTPLRMIEHPWYRAWPVRAAGTALTFLCVTIGWVPFMLPLNEAAAMLALMFGAAR